jgi:CBS domain-containing protein
MLEKEIRTLEAAALVNKEKIEKITLDFTRKSSESGKLFGSVTNRDVELALSERGINIDRRNVTPAHVKTVGESIVEVKLFKAIKATIKLNIIPEYIEEDTKENEENENNEEVSTAQEEVVQEEEFEYNDQFVEIANKALNSTIKYKYVVFALIFIAIAVAGTLAFIDFNKKKQTITVSQEFSEALAIYNSDIVPNSEADNEFKTEEKKL